MSGNVEVLTAVMAPESIVAGLPEGGYSTGRAFQPRYENLGVLEDAVQRIQEIGPITTPERVLALRAKLSAVAEQDDIPLIMGGRCSEMVRTGAEEVLAEEVVVTEKVVAAAGLKKAVVVNRGGGQNGKPRSNEHEEVDDGTLVESFMGEGVNDISVDDRTPDPHRLVAAAEQAQKLRVRAEELTGHDVMWGHEALLLPYEQAQVYINPATGKKVILSSELLWLGERTNRTDIANPHLEMLRDVENPVGVKIGPKSDEQHIAKLAQALNPDGESGKLIWMIRVGSDAAAMRRVARGIKQHSPNSLVTFDIHGSNENEEDESGKTIKVRSVEATVEHIRLLAEICSEEGLRLHGVHIETTGDDSRQECVRSRGELPTDKPEVDPLFGPTLFGEILQQVKPYLPGGALEHVNL